MPQRQGQIAQPQNNNNNNNNKKFKNLKIKKKVNQLNNNSF